MIRQYRLPAPDWLDENAEKWGKRFETRISDPKKKNHFIWPTHNQQKVHHQLLPLLRKATKGHCSFCDAYPMGPRLEETIDHFRPKTQFPLLVCEWENLFLCCRLCQRKNEQFDELLLKPDEDTYAFQHYFIFNYLTGEIEVNPMESLENQARAEKSIELFQLNDHGKPVDRIEVFKKYDESISKNASEFSYRFMF